MNNVQLHVYSVYRGHDRMVDGFKTTYMQSVHITTNSYEFEVYDTTLCDKVCQLLVTGQWYSPGTLVSSINKTDRHDIAEILLKVALNTIILTHNMYITHLCLLRMSFQSLRFLGR